MKIRCEQNSIRLRLRKSELVQLRAEQWLETTLAFPGGFSLAWEITVESDGSDVAAAYEQGRISIRIPATVAFAWMESDEVGLEYYLPVGEGAALHVLIEKDFPCKTRPDEDKSDFFAELAEDTPVKC